MKIYTRTGDKGTTALFGGERVPKDHSRIAAYGTVDEANSFIGLALAHLRTEDSLDDLVPLLERLQDALFIVGADLATPQEAKPSVPRVTAEHVQQVEDDIDRLQEALPPLTQFILPGGSPGAATLHVARTVCRRAERLGLKAARDGSINKQALIYLNRLSDLLFVAARWANHRAGAPESTWSPPHK
jgi:cob(I)alamin adenosyltransferase